MKLLRFLPAALNSWLGLAASLPMILRLGWFAMAVSLAAGTASPAAAKVSPEWLRVTTLVDHLAATCFAVAWLRHVALGERPEGWMPLSLGRRELFFALFWIAANTFVAYPGTVLAENLSLVTGIDGVILAVPLLVASYALLGAFLLLPVEYALKDARTADRPMPDLLMQGGFAVGIGLVPVWGPPALAMSTLAAQSMSPLAAKSLILVPQYLGAAAVAGYLGLVWRNLVAEAS
jgi:hypothetical protein